MLENALRSAYSITFLLLWILGPAAGTQLSFAQSDPNISNIQHQPSAPTHDEAVTVSAQVSSDTTITSVQIEWSVNNNDQEDIAMDAGGGSTYQGILPGQSVGSTIRYRITATNAAGGSSSSAERSYRVSLAAPSGLTATLIEPVVELEWGVVPGAASYILYRSLEFPSNDEDHVEYVRGITETAYVDDRIGSTRELYYSVKAVAGSDLSSFSNVASIFELNFAPTARFGNRIDTLLVFPRLDGEPPATIEITLDSLFFDQNGDVLTYTFIPIDLNPDIAAILLEGSQLLISTANSLGTTSFAVEARDPFLGSNTITFVIRVDAAPRFVYEGDAPHAGRDYTREEPVLIEVDVTDNNLERVDITFKRGGDATYFLDEMAPLGGDRFAYEIPAFAVGDRGIEYSLSAVDRAGLIQVAPDPVVDDRPFFAVQIDLPGEGVRKEQPQPGQSTGGNAYRLISLPVAADNADPVSVLEDDLGAYKDYRWRFFEPQHGVASEALPEYPNVSPMEPGRAFWLIVNDTDRFIDSGPATTNPTDRPFPVPLEPGWNYIGNPFTIETAVADRRIYLGSGGSPDIRYFNGTQWETVDPGALLLPFEGYAVSNNQAATDTLYFDLSRVGLDAAAEKHVSSPPADPPAWSIRIIAEAGGLRDDDNVAAAYPESDAAWDLLDRPEPPYIGSYLSVYFPHTDWERPIERYSRDVRPVSPDGESWRFEVATNLGETVFLTFEGLEDLPPQFEARLIDEQAGVTQPLGESDAYPLASSSTAPRTFTLVVGTPAYQETQFGGRIAMPEDYALDPSFPNPFRATTTIPYSLPASEYVTLHIFNSLGERVATLLDGASREAGRHAAVWDGRNDAGRPVASGLYFIQLNAGSYAETRTVTRLK